MYININPILNIKVLSLTQDKLKNYQEHFFKGRSIISFFIRPFDKEGEANLIFLSVPATKMRKWNKFSSLDDHLPTMSQGFKRRSKW